MRPPSIRLGGTAVALVLVAAAGLAMKSQDPSPEPQGSALTSVPRVPTTFATQQHRPYSPPPVIRSVNGVLATTFTVRPKTFDVAGKRVRGLTYQGGFMGPTLRVRPGDTVRIHLRNELGEPTNLHSHGMYVSPIGISDNVLRTMKAHSNNDFVLKLPRNVDPGTYWYHTHLHGLTEEQVFAGLSGVLDRQRAPAAVAPFAARRPRAPPGAQGPAAQAGRRSCGTTSTPTHRRPAP